MKINDCGWFQRVILGGIFMLGIAGIVASGGGDGEEEDEIIIQSIYEFLIGGPLIDDPGNSTIGITKQDEFTVITEPNLVGTVICDQVTEVCELQTIDPPSSIIMSGDYDIRIEVLNTWNYNPLPSDRPRFGRSLIERVGKPDIFAKVMDCGGGSPGVDVQGTTDDTDGCYPWDTFEALADNPEISGDAALASLAWEAVAFIVEQGSNALEVFPLIVDDVFATLGNPIS